VELLSWVRNLRYAAINIASRDGAQSFYFENEQARIAWSLAAGYGFSSPWPNTPFLPTAQQPPLYPWLLAAIFWIFGAYSVTSVWVTVTINAVLSGLTSALIYRTALKHFDRATGLLATALWLSIALSTRFRDSVLSALLVVVAVFLLPEHDRKPIPLSRWVALGGLAGIAMLCNTSLAAIFIPFLGYLWFWEHRAGRQSAVRLIVALGICALILLPWTVRNNQVFHRLIPVRDNFGLELWVGNHPGVTYICDYGNSFPADHPEEYNRLGEIGFFDARGKIALDFVSSQPGRFVRLTLQRAGYFWSAPPENIKAMTPVWVALSLVSMVGATLAIRERGLSVVPCALTLLFPLVYYVSHPLAIYRHPIEPVLLLAASFAMVTAFRSITAAWSDRFTASVNMTDESTNW
jgi:4-amino-4-deoxy-L-arabinose transferase-like glycosyltransferase